MFKRVISLCVTAIILSSIFSNLVYAENNELIYPLAQNEDGIIIEDEVKEEIQSVDLSNPTTDVSGEDSSFKCIDNEELVQNEDEMVSLQATTWVNCSRLWQKQYGKRFYVYKSINDAINKTNWRSYWDTDTGPFYFQTSGYYNVDGIYVYEYYYYSDFYGGYGYGYFTQNNSLATLDTIYHTYDYKTHSGKKHYSYCECGGIHDSYTDYSTSHANSYHYDTCRCGTTLDSYSAYSYSTHSGSYHYDVCKCGTYYNSYYSSSCYDCYPGTLKYYANGGSGAPSNKTVYESYPTISSTKPTRFGYKFLGWSTSSTATSASYEPGEDIYVGAGSTKNLYAVWESYYTLSGNSYSDSTRIRIGGTMGYFRFTPSESGTYVFQSTNSSENTYGYLYKSNGTQLDYDDDDGDGSNFKIKYNLSAGTTYYYGVKWYDSTKTGRINVKLSRQYSISYNANGGSGAPSSQTKLHGDNLTLSSIKPVRNLWQFNGWATSSTATSAQYQAGGSYTGNGDQTLYAVWGYPTGSCGTNATWTFSPEDNSLTISGSGAMNDYSATSTAPWNAYVDNIDTISIADGITAIGNYAFSGCKNITSLNLPSTIADIGEYAFSGCSALATINIPSGVTVIEKYTFNNCSALIAPTLPETVTSIGEYAFSGCSSITEMILPDSVASIRAYAFSGCSNMESINIPSGVTSIEAYTFNGNTKLNEIVIPDTIKVIKEYAFYGCTSIPSVIIPKSVTEIQRAAFLYCSALESITIPDNVTVMGTSVFSSDSNVVIKCYYDTIAHKYAQNEELLYEIMLWGTMESPTITKTDIVGGVSVSISAPKGTIYYTSNGTEPTVDKKNKYNGPFDVKSNKTIKAIVVEDYWGNSPVAEMKIELEKVATPFANTTSGRVIPGTKIELYCETDGAEIWCTTDGSMPTEDNVYADAIEINENMTIFAVAVKDGMLVSNQAIYTYEISNASDIPVVTTLPATDITETSAKLSASVDDSDGVLRMVEFIYYEKNNSNNKYYATADNTHSAIITGLTPNTEYWYQARALNELGWSPPGYIEIFTTDAQGVIKPTSVEIEPSYLKMNPGKKKTLLATVLPMASDNREVYWSSEDTSVVTVDENGVVTAVGLGNTRIKVTTVSSRLEAYCNVDVVSSEVQGEFDFSEHHMITNSSFYDEYGYDYAPDKGGNALMASAYLARWDGAVLEENDTYPYDGKVESIKYKGDIASDYHVQNIIYLPYRQDALDNDEIKKAIMKYGAVYSSFKVGVTDDEKSYKFFNGDMSNYCFPQDDDTSKFGGHAIVIVGWDDNYSRTKFDVIPSGDGAFICKNSWGTTSGENGYFYISYYDKYLGKYNKEAGQTDYNAVFYNVENADNYNKIYQYDYLGPVVATDEFDVKKLYSANVFPEAGSALQENEALKAVSFYNYSPGMPYEIYIVTNYQNANSLKNLGSPVKTGVSEYAGYLTVNLDNAIELASGTRFAVVVKTTAKNGNTKVFVEMPVKDKISGKSHSSNARANKGESYIGMDKKTWMDLTDSIPNANLCIKAFTQTDEGAILLQGIDNVGRKYESDKVYTIDELAEKGYDFDAAFVEYLKEPEEVELFTTGAELNLGAVPPSFVPDLNTNNNYSEGAALPPKYDLREEEAVTSVKNQGLIGSCWAFATYASMESALKKASFLSQGGSGGSLNQSTSGASSIYLNTTGTRIALGNSLQLRATVMPIDSTAELVWKSSNNSIVSVSSRGIITGLGIGQATVTVSTANGEVSAQCAITVTAPVSVDSITINNAETQIVAGNKLLLDYSVYPENAGDKNIIWEVDNSSVASVNEYGLLTAKGGGTVTITAYSADRSVSDTYTLDIDDGCDCNIEITDNNLGIYDTNIFGSLSVNVTNKTTKTINGTVIMAIYNSTGEVIKVLPQDKELLVGNNSVEFKNVYVSGLTGKNLKVKIFVWDSIKNLKAIAVLKEDVIE